MVRLKNRTLAHVPVYTAIIIIVLMAVGLGGYSAASKYKNYINTKEAISDQFNKDYRNRLIEEMSVITDFISYKQKLAAKNLESQLQQKVQIAYVTASHIYSFNKGNLPEETIKTMIIETLRPIRWDTNQGYYFIGDALTGRIILQSNEPSLEGKIQINLQDADGQFIIQEIIDTIKTRGAGLLTYKWMKPGETDLHHLKSSFVKGFMPFNWYIGAGIYLDEVQSQVQEDVLQRIRDMKFARYGSIACIRGDGQTLVDFEPAKDGRLITSVLDDSGNKFGREIVYASSSADRRGFVKSHFYKPGTEELTPRLSYVHYFEEWDWILITSMFEDEMIAAIEAETAKFRQSTVRDIIIITILFIISLAGVFVFVFYYSSRLKDDIQLFTEFFKETAYKKIPLEEKNLAFNEFYQLGQFANNMVEERNRAELLVRKDELRFNTLYSISKMQGKPLLEVCTFALKRTLMLSDSTAGFICLIGENNDRADVIGMLMKDDRKSISTIESKSIVLDENTSTYLALKQNKTIRNRIGQYNNLIVELFDIDREVCKMSLDVPISDGSKTVAVAGVCNKLNGVYNESDEKELAVVYEGVWHHFIRERNEKEKARLRNLLESINDSMSSMIICVDSNCDVIQWNKQTESITSISEKDAQGRPVSTLLPRLKTFVPLIEGVIRNGIPKVTSSFEWADKESKRFEDISIFPLVGTQFQGAVIRIDDVTEKVRMEDMMLQSEKMLSVGGLAAGMAHEINNPLAGIMQNLQVARSRLTTRLNKNEILASELGIDLNNLAIYLEKRHINQMFDAVEESARKAAGLVKNMLSFSRKSDSVFTSTDIIELLDNTLELVSNDYDLKKNYDFRKISVIKQYEDNLPLIPCEQQNIQQVFFNLLKNGAHALYQKEYIDDGPQILISVKHDESNIYISIEDNGPGIKEELVKRIFEPFFTTKPVGVGTGLGLSISYFIINQQHNGTIEVNSVSGEGTRFMIKLPLERNTALNETGTIG